MSVEELEATVKEIRTIQTQLSDVAQQQEKLIAQENENQLVLEEFRIAEKNGTDTVYKKVGPALVKQPLSEAKSTVEKRLEYIRSELRSRDSQIDSLQKKSVALQQKAVQIQRILAQQRK